MERQTIDLSSMSVSDHLSFVVIEYLILLPLICAIYIVCRRKKLHKKKYKKTCGEFLDGTKYEKRGHWKSALTIALVFFVRRALLCFVLVVSHDFLWGQIAQALMITTMMIIFLQWFGPLQNSKSVTLETFNEIINLMILYLLMCFSEFIGNPNMKRILGFLFIATVCSFASFYIFILVRSSVRELRKRARKAYEKWQKKQKKKLKKQLKYEINQNNLEVVTKKEDPEMQEKTATGAQSPAKSERVPLNTQHERSESNQIINETVA